MSDKKTIKFHKKQDLIEYYKDKIEEANGLMFMGLDGYQQQHLYESIDLWTDVLYWLEKE